jgi:SAM-dependent methyltransferase
VRATDASAAQLAHAAPHPRVTYALGREDESGLAGASADLVTCAQAVHWLDLDAFYAEVRRVLRPGGAIAVWAYGALAVEGPAGAVLDWFYAERVGAHWPAERAVVDAGLRTIPFPFAPLAAPPFHLRAELSLDTLLGYVGTWSAVHACTKAEGTSPLGELRERLAPFWPHAGTREVRWPVALRLGRLA